MSGLKRNVLGNQRKLPQTLVQAVEDRERKTVIKIFALRGWLAGVHSWLNDSHALLTHLLCKPILMGGTVEPSSIHRFVVIVNDLELSNCSYDQMAGNPNLLTESDPNLLGKASLKKSVRKRGRELSVVKSKLLCWCVMSFEFFPS